MSSTPNYFHRAYSIGRTHTSMLAYLADMYNDERASKQPLQNVLAVLIDSELKLPDYVEAVFEFKHCDIVFRDKHQHCFLAFEMKIDDRESRKKASKDDARYDKRLRRNASGPILQGGYYQQADLYQHRLHQHNWRLQEAEDFEPTVHTAGSEPVLKVVTLGVGELSCRTGSIGLDKWHKAFAGVRDVDMLCSQYVAALELEQDVRRAASSVRGWQPLPQGLLSDHPDQRNNNHPAMYRLGSLVERIGNRPITWPNEVGWGPHITIAGAGDVILQFNYPADNDQWQETCPLYVELNSNGKLSFKLAAVQIKRNEAKQEIYLHCQDALVSAFGNTAEFDCANSSSYTTAAHRTVGALEVGLDKYAKLSGGTTEEQVIERVKRGLHEYGNVMSSLFQK